MDHATTYTTPGERMDAKKTEEGADQPSLLQRLSAARGSPSLLDRLGVEVASFAGTKDVNDSISPQTFDVYTTSVRKT